MPIELREPASEEECEKYYDLRWRVLRKSWGGAKASAADPREQSAFHLTAWEGIQLVGCGRFEILSPEEAQIRGMAVDPDYANQGIGSRILNALEKQAAARGVKRMVLHGRENAVPFYRKNGYKTVEQSYTLFGCIAHWRMEKSLLRS